jgi:carboxymethylenebutenolidase
MTYALQDAEHKTRADEIYLNVDNSHMEAYVAHPSTGFGPWPAVLVLMEIFGVNSHIRSVCDYLAGHGYVAMAYNYYHRTTPNLDLGYTAADVEIGRQHKALVTREGILMDTRAAMDYLRGRADVEPKNCFGVAGFCFGGHLAYLLASMPEVAATASFYGGGITSMPLANSNSTTLDVTPNIHGEILCFFGEKDALISGSDVETLRASLQSARINHQVVTYPEAGHGFCCDQRADFVPEAAEDAWKQVLTMFDRRLKRP